MPQTINPSISSQKNSHNHEWWRGAAIYQIYPRSFFDTTGNGIGDLRGIWEKLPYIQNLGVDAIWISPFFTSPMRDFGYDISDYRNVDPLFGSLDDFDRIIEKAHQLGLKVMIDQVLSHTSNDHAWFKESRENRTNPKADWYVWAEAKSDGTAPNNWLSIFGGSAWQWEPRRQQYYLHNFLASQPDLNINNPQVQQQMLDEVAFWLGRGVDGLRLDAINFCCHDPQLRNNPAKPQQERNGRGFSPDNPYAAQRHLYDNTQPQALDFLKQLRALLNRYGDRVSLGEINSEQTLQTMADYCNGDEHLHMAYNFELLSDDFSPAFLRQTISATEDKLTNGWPCWAMNNHDAVRSLSRWGKHIGQDLTSNEQQAFAQLLIMLLGSLRGSFCVYQGEELGLLEADLRFDQLQDPFGLEFWPTFKGRDGCRTPMPWEIQQAHGGFTTGTPWLPVNPPHQAMAVSEQEKHSDSLLSFYQTFLHWRKEQPALRWGDFEWLTTDTAPEGDHYLLFQRTYVEKPTTHSQTTHAQTLLIAINLSRQPNTIVLPALKDNRWVTRLTTCQEHPDPSQKKDQRILQLSPLSVWVGEKAAIPTSTLNI